MVGARQGGISWGAGRRTAWAAPVVAGVICATLAASAQAGTYSTSACRLGQGSDGARIGVDGWSPSDSGGAHIFNACSSGGGFGASLESGREVDSGSIAKWTFNTPGNTRIVRFDGYRSGATAPRLRDGGIPRYLFIEGSGTRELIDGKHDFDGGSAFATDVTSLQFKVECNNSDPCRDTDNPTYVTFRNAMVTLRDLVAPAASDLAGALSGTDRKRGTSAMTFRATDAGGGIWKIETSVDGKLVHSTTPDTNGGHCVDQNGYNPGVDSDRVVPCPLAVDAGAGIDTTKYADGDHELKVVMVDAGDNRTAVLDRTITIHNAPELTTAPSPGTTDAPTLGQTLTGDRGAWDENGVATTYATQWLRCDESDENCSAIPGADAITYRIGDADVGHRLRLQVTATSTYGSQVERSGATGRVQPGPASADASGGFVAGDGRDGRDGSGSDGHDGAAAADPPAASVPNGVNATAAATVSARLASTTRRSVTLRYGKRTRIRGRLVTVGGRPISGARLDVIVGRLVRRAKERRVATVTTKADGSYSYLTPRGGSRDVRIEYRTRTGDATAAATSQVRVRVRSGVSMRVSPTRTVNGHKIRFRGKVRGASKRSRKLVEMQVRQGGRWLTFGVTRLRKGRFHYSYRFRRTHSTTRYTFRARVKAEATWPYATGVAHSRRVTVRGR